MNPKAKQNRLKLLHFHDQLIAGIENGNKRSFGICRRILQLVSRGSPLLVLRAMKAMRGMLDEMQDKIDDENTPG